MDRKTILVTGVAGFIGSFFCREVLKKFSGICVIGLDNLNDYYDKSLKMERLKSISEYKNFKFIEMDISDNLQLKKIFEEYLPNIVVNLAAQAGVRYSIINPDAYIQSNIIGFYNILEVCRASQKWTDKVEHLIYASSSSVYGENNNIPFSEEEKTDKPVSLYAATKKSNELMAYAYSKLYNFPVTGLRFFTVYGPLGRPDMAYYKFAEKMVNGEPIQLYNNGEMFRDFTYIDDVIRGILLVMEQIPCKDRNCVRSKVYNIGNGHPESLEKFVKILKENLRERNMLKYSIGNEYLPMQPGDVSQTYADMKNMKDDFGFEASVSLEEGLKRFVEWYVGWKIKI